MSIFICLTLSIWLPIYLYLHLSIYIHICVYLFIYACVYKNMWIYVYIYVFVCLCVRVRVCFMYVSLSRGRHPLGPETRSAKAEGNIQVTDSEFMCSCPEAAVEAFSCIVSVIGPAPFVIRLMRMILNVDLRSVTINSNSNWCSCCY